jgi:hypothetical protein
MKKIYFLIVFFGAILFCACEKENSDLFLEDQSQTQIDETALKGADSNGMTKVHMNKFPAWARMAMGSPYVIPSSDEYGIIAFYVNDPNLIWNYVHDCEWDFMVHGGMAPQAMALPEEVFTIEVDSWFLPDYPMAPHHYHLEGREDVLFWIITFEQVLDVIADGHLTIAELEACKPLVGHASKYREELRPFGGGAKVFGGIFNAQGELEDGRRFILHINNQVKPGEPIRSVVHFEIIGK